MVYLSVDHGTIAEEEEPGNENSQQQRQLMEETQSFKRYTEEAFTSWGIGDALSGLDLQARGLNLSVVGSSVDILTRRGKLEI